MNNRNFRKERLDMSNKIKKLFALACRAASRHDRRFRRDYLIGAIGIRKDGARVSSQNLPNDNKSASHHAETRLCKKLDFGSEVFVVRIGRDGKLMDCIPCPWCMKNLMDKGVRRCYYSLEDGFGVLQLN
jgi:tRNA(Arg) A34 adenosine deaminase TadA